MKRINVVQCQLVKERTMSYDFKTITEPADAARIISNDLNIGFSQEYCLTFVYPPSMYQHLKAWTVLYSDTDPSYKNLATNSFLGE